MSPLDKLHEALDSFNSEFKETPSVIVMNPGFWTRFLRDCAKHDIELPISQDPKFNNITIRRSNDIEDGNFELY